MKYFHLLFFFFVIIQMTPLNMESTPFIASASPGLSMGLPQVVWDPLLGQWQPCTDEVASSSVNLSALTPLSESSSTTLAKPVSCLQILFVKKS